MNKDNNPFYRLDKGLVEVQPKYFSPFEKALVEVKPKYSNEYNTREIVFVSKFLDAMSLEEKKLELTPSDLLDIITKHIVDRFYDDIDLEKEWDLYISEKEYAEIYYACITRAIKNSIRDRVNYLYPNFMSYINLTEEEVNQVNQAVYKKKKNGFKYYPSYAQYRKEGVKYYKYIKCLNKRLKIVNKVHNDLLEVFFLRCRDL